MKKTEGVPVTMRALIQRINRKIAMDGEVLKTARGQAARAELGDYYIINVHHNFVSAKDVDLEARGRELGVLRPYECIAE
jgi:hypothetical protein